MRSRVQKLVLFYDGNELGVCIIDCDFDDTRFQEMAPETCEKLHRIVSPDAPEFEPNLVVGFNPDADLDVAGVTLRNEDWVGLESIRVVRGEDVT